MATGRTDKEHLGHGYTTFGKTATIQTRFVKASMSGVKKDEDLKLKASVMTPGKTPATTLEEDLL